MEVFDLRKWSWSERWGNLGRAKSQDSGPSVGPVGISYRHNSPNHSPSARARSACPIPELASSHFSADIAHSRALDASLVSAEERVPPGPNGKMKLLVLNLCLVLSTMQHCPHQARSAKQDCPRRPPQRYRQVHLCRSSVLACLGL